MSAVPPAGEVILSGASWSDTDMGTTEEASFAGATGQRILTVLHRPTTGTVTEGVLFCGSLFEDFQVNYRTELLVARALAGRGRAAMRLHYRGQGNSDDIPGGMTFETMLADARQAAALLHERTGATRLTLVGSRLGALVAARLAAEDDQTPLVLWSPIVDGGDFFRGMSRASRLAGLRAQARTGDGATGAEPGGRADGAVEMLGNLVHRATRRDLTSRALPRSVGPRRVLLVQLGLGDADDPRYSRFVASWTAGGAHVDLLRVRARQLWMVPDKWEPEDDWPTTRDQVEGIAGWIAAPGGPS